MNYLAWHIIDQTKNVLFSGILTAFLLMFGFMLNHTHPSLEQFLIINIIVVLFSTPNLKDFYINLDSLNEYFERYGDYYIRSV